MAIKLTELSFLTILFVSYHVYKQSHSFLRGGASEWVLHVPQLFCLYQWRHDALDFLKPMTWTSLFFGNFVEEWISLAPILGALDYLWFRKARHSIINVNVKSVQISHSVVSDSLWPHEPQHARPPCPSPTASIYPNPCPLSWRCHPTISSSVILFPSCPQSLPASGSFQMSQLLHQVAKDLEFQLQNQSFQWTPRTDFL